MLVNLSLLIIGLFILVKAGDYLVDGASSLAKKWKVSSFIIGMTIVSFGTSLPEVLVNVIASFKGSYDVGMGNIVGSNISNTFLVLGVSAIIISLKVDKETLTKYIPFSILSVIVLFVLANGTLINGNGSPGGLFRSDGIILLVYFSIFLYFILNEKENIEKQEDIKERSLLISWLMTIGGLAGLYLGAELTVNNSVSLAQYLGASEALVGILVVGLGTSLPELAACVAAASKKNFSFIWGNIVGSNIFNILWVLGISSFIKPIEYSSMLDIDIGIVILSSIILIPLIIFGKKNYLSRGGGIILISFYIAYVIYVVIRG